MITDGRPWSHYQQMGYEPCGIRAHPFAGRRIVA